MTEPEPDYEPESDGCDHCERKSCGGYRHGYPKCGGPPDYPDDPCAVCGRVIPAAGQTVCRGCA